MGYHLKSSVGQGISFPAFSSVAFDSAIIAPRLAAVRHEHNAQAFSLCSIREVLELFVGRCQCEVKWPRSCDGVSESLALCFYSCSLCKFSSVAAT